jgi:hypothetical protein
MIVFAVAVLDDANTTEDVFAKVAGSSRYVATHVVPPSKDTSGTIVPINVPAASWNPTEESPAVVT